MAPSTIKKAIGAVKDQTSIRLAKVAGNSAPDLEVLVVKATTHGKRAADEKYAKEILNLMSCSRTYVNACVSAVSKRLSKTSDWIVALKALVLVHKLLNEGGTVFRQEMLFSSKRGVGILNMSSFRDDAHSTSWDQSSFVRAYALYLDQKLEVVMTYGRKVEKKRNECDEDEDEDEDGFRINRRVKSYDDLNDSMRERKEVMWLKDLAPEKVLERLNQLLRVLDRFLASRPTGAAKKSRMVLVALHLLVKDSFRVYDDICDVLKYLLDCFLDLEYAYTVKAFDAYVNASKMMDELTGFYDWVKDVGIVRASEIPEVKKISDQLLGSLEGLLREKGNRPNSVNEIKDKGQSFSQIKDERELEEEESVNEIKSLPLPENYNTTSTVSQPLHQPQSQQVITEDLVNLKNEEEESNDLALFLFSEWAEFPEGNKVNSPWDNPAAEEGSDDWEMVLVESASNLSMQKAEFGGVLDPLWLDGMYDLGTVKKEARAYDMIGGSASSVALPGADDLNIFLTYIVCISWSRGNRGLLYPRVFYDILNADTDTYTHVDVVNEWRGKAEQMYEGKPVSPFDFLEFLHPMAHLPPDRSPVTEMLAKSREDADLAKFLPFTLAVSAILAYASGGGFGEGVRNWFKTEVMKLDWFNNEERGDEIEERKRDIDKCTYEMETLCEMLHSKKNNDGLGCCACSLQ